MTHRRPHRSRIVSAAPILVLLFSLSACETGSTDVTGEATGPTETAPTGPTQTSGPTAATGATGAAVLEGTWSGTWDTDVPQVKGTFSWVIEATPDGFTGTIEVQNTSCISNGTVDVALDGDTITVGSRRGRGAGDVHGHDHGRPDVGDLRRRHLSSTELGNLGGRPLGLATVYPKRP